MNTLRASLLSGTTTNRPLLHNYSQQQSRDQIPDRVVEVVTDKSFPRFKSNLFNESRKKFGGLLCDVVRIREIGIHRTRKYEVTHMAFHHPLHHPFLHILSGIIDGVRNSCMDRLNQVSICCKHHIRYLAYR